MADVEIYTPSGVIAGETAGTPLTPEGPDLAAPLEVRDARWYPLDGGPPSQRDRTNVAPDDILLVVTGDQDTPVHMNCYPITLDIGPYRVSATIPMLPGFDPDRALSRPGHTHIPLRDATIELLGRGDVAPAQRPHLHVNRYAVERVSTSLMLGFFFPGAQFVQQEAVPVA